jgi:hypothetical protein
MKKTRSTGPKEGAGPWLDGVEGMSPFFWGGIWRPDDDDPHSAFSRRMQEVRRYRVKRHTDGNARRQQRKAERAFFHVNLQGTKGLKTFASNAMVFCLNEFFTILIWIHSDSSINTTFASPAVSLLNALIHSSKNTCQPKQITIPMQV